MNSITKQQSNKLKDAALKAKRRQAQYLRDERRRRNDEISKLYQSGLTLEEVGQAFGITRERVRQILYKNNTPIRTKHDRAAIVDAEADLRIEEVVEAYLMDPHMARVADALGMTKVQVRRIVFANVEEHRRRAGALHPEISDAVLISYLKRAKVKVGDKRLSIERYNMLRKKYPTWPSSLTITKRFDTWNKAIAHVGEESYATPDGYGSQLITDEQVLEGVRAAWKHYGKAPTIAQYDVFYKEHGYPSLGTVRNRYKSWVTALEYAKDTA